MHQGGAARALQPADLQRTTYSIARQLLRLWIIHELSAVIDDREEFDAIAARLLDVEHPVEWTALAPWLSVGDLEAEVVLDKLLSSQLEIKSEPGAKSPSTEVESAYERMALARLEHEIAMLHERGNVIRITNWISWLIFVVAHIILGVGLWAAVREFLHAAETRRQAPEPLPAKSGEEDGGLARLAAAQNEIKISLEGIALKTSLHGLVLLCAAIGFYFLYLKFVYPITVVTEPGAAIGMPS